MDPQQSLVLGVGYGALRGGGDFAASTRPPSVRSALTRADVGVFVGVEPSGLSSRQDAPNVFSASGGALSVTSGRLSYSLGLVGPCYSIDTACASALAALHACVVAVGRECASGLGTGTKVLSAAANLATSIAGMTSAFGRCHTFDRRADGYCRGEGCGAYVVETRADGARILGSAVQQDGPSASLTAPNGSSQQRLLEAVPGDGRPALEAHGTGTALGDPIEVRVVLFRVRFSMDSSQVGAATRAVRAPMASTSLKSNMGHLEAAAAAAGLASVVAGPLLAGIVPVNAQLRGYARAASRTERARTRFTPG